MTYPELSIKYLETVCSGGVLEDGTPVRLYPIPYRYLDGPDKFHKYQWITANIARNTSDPRPESVKVQPGSIQCLEKVKTSKDEWGIRSQLVFPDPSWQFESMDALIEAQSLSRRSLGVVTPRKILDVKVVDRTDEKADSFRDKLELIRKQVEIDRAQLNLFEEETPDEMKTLDFVQYRLQIEWLCASADCQKHKMQVLDWEVAELHRREGDEKALRKLCEICDLSNYALRFFLGNFRLYPTAFTIVGLWYPKRADDRLFK
jgi:hypothetical protein